MQIAIATTLGARWVRGVGLSLLYLVGCSSTDGGNTNASAGAAGGPIGASAGNNSGGSPNPAQGGSAANTPFPDEFAGGPSGGGTPIAHGGAPDVDYGNMAMPPAQWTNITGTFAGMQSECGNFGGVYPSPYEDKLILGVARQGLFSSVDGGTTYQAIGTTGDKILNRLAMVIWDPAATQVFWTSGIYGWESPFTDGVFKTTDGGASFVGYAKLAMIQSANDSVSIDFNDPARKTMLSGGHEQAGLLFRSTDAGETWTDIGSSLPNTVGFCTTSLVLDAQTFLVGCAAGYSKKSGAILRSSDGGKTWSQVSGKGVSGQPLWAYDGSIYWAGEGGGMFKSADFGKTFTQVADAGTAGSTVPIQLPTGAIVSSAQKSLKLSPDAGKTWIPVATDMPWAASGIAYSPFRRAFYAWHWDCTNNVPADAIQRFGYDYLPK